MTGEAWTLLGLAWLGLTALAVVLFLAVPAWLERADDDDERAAWEAFASGDWREGDR